MAWPPVVEELPDERVVALVLRGDRDAYATLVRRHQDGRIPLDHPEAAGALEVALFYKLTPYWKDAERPDPEHEARLVERVELAP